ncbi:Putative non-hem dioxygenase domain, isopenicillin N synthase-like superfamily [Septoria linicola]|uniref:Non-hem dioxygenase domain, isopenicillin N synthase-like superfamily n=1 Tax=Septoria linicola TaxID=215465 RepID=A0A9Q9EHY6_9PEZI|nr:putative non-hem dioxygenase domain, isopenicillin N synthase-like superfamily [Septoria linicola]USW51465.1 Putative non-hem dioxygenase domain, isopenicillin N synthase-like superfamily [Septoria linicola]
MGSIAHGPGAPPWTIPVIDFARWRQTTNLEEGAAVAKDLISACQTIGFVYIINHGLPQDLLDEAFNTSKRLFDLPLPKKMLAPHPDGSDIHRGYSYPGLEKVSPYSVATSQKARGCARWLT